MEKILNQFYVRGKPSGTLLRQETAWLLQGRSKHIQGLSTWRSKLVEASLITTMNSGDQIEARARNQENNLPTLARASTNPKDPSTTFLCSLQT
jgi:hypothetical protein